MMPREPSDRAKRFDKLFLDWQYLDDVIGRALLAYCSAFSTNQNESYVLLT
jgi:hypothetical protein